MRRSTFPRLGVALFLTAVSSSITTVAAAQSATEPVTATSSATTLVAPALGQPAKAGGEIAPSANGNNAANETRSVLLDRRAAGLTRASNVAARSETPVPAPRQENGHTRTNTALMIVGAAAIVLGAAVGDEAGTVLIIGGAGVGLFGLYRLLN
jgi:hypothetical protein